MTRPGLRSSLSEYCGVTYPAPTYPPACLVNLGSHPFIHIQEPCTHDVQLHGMCALCGKDLTA